MKRCGACGEDKTLAEFHRNRSKPDGYSGQCKRCSAAYQKRYTKTAKARSTKADYRRRSKSKIATYQAQYSAKPESKEKARAKARHHAELHPERKRARQAVSNAVRAGLLIRPAVCSKCGSTDAQIEGHHPEYSKPMMVVWLCDPCHTEVRLCV